MPVKCFLVEKTGQRQMRRCVCADPACTQQYEEIEWRRVDTGETLWGWPSAFGPGAMWLDEPNGYHWKNDDTTPHLIVVTPGGSWDIDGRAGNCTRKDDTTHRCWIRHGEPPNVTVNKSGNTCSAGVGSIQCGSYHGFLQNGVLT